MAEEESLFGRLIYGYSRAQAIADGVIVDVTETAKEAGFKYPVALTRAVWDVYVRVPPKVDGQDEKGRLWDILQMLVFHIKKGGTTGHDLFRLRVRNSRLRSDIVELRAVCGPGDNPDPVITIMMPDES